MTEKTFRSNPAYRDELKKFLDSECGKAMLSIISERKTPKNLPIQQPGVPLDTLFAHQLNRCYEATHMIEAIMRLSEPLSEQETRKEEEAEFFYGLPEEMKKKILQMQQRQA